MTEQRHEGLERHAGVDQRGGVGVAQLVWGDVADPGGLGAAGEFVARTAFWESRRPWWVNKNCVGRPVRGWGSGRPVLRVCGDPVDRG